MSSSLITRPVRFSPEALATVDRLAQAAGITPSAFIRATVDKEIGRPDPLSSPAAVLATELAELSALRQEWQRVMVAVSTRLTQPPPPGTATPPHPDESGLADLTLS